MKTLNENQRWSVSLKTSPNQIEEEPRPKIGDDDGISNRTMNMFLLLFMFFTVGLSIAIGTPTDNAKYRVLLRQAMLDMDRSDYDKAISKLLEVRANTDENANVNQMIGICYLYGQNSPEKAVFYFNRAVSNMSAEYESWDMYEKRAPVQTAYHLAKAYEAIQDFAKAAEYYGVFLAFIDDDSSLASGRTYSIISRNAEKCRTSATQGVGVLENENIVLNR